MNITEEHAAFHEMVTLLSWQSTSRAGYKFKLGLPSRAELAHFDQATRRSGKRAGQRYVATLTETEEATLLPPTTMRLWFSGANWAHQEGARVTFTTDEEGFEAIRAYNPKDSNLGTPAVFWLTLVQVDEDELPINQVAQTRLEVALGDAGPAGPVNEPGVVSGVPLAPPEPDKPKGGPRSKQVAMTCQETEFQYYVGEQEGYDKATFAQADAYVKRIVGFTSKVELDQGDRGDAIWQAFITKIRRPYFEWAGNGPAT